MSQVKSMDDNSLNISVSPIFLPLFDPSNKDIDRWILYGGRDSGKSVTMSIFGMLAGVQRASEGKTGRIIAARSTQTSLRDSMLAELQRVTMMYPKLAPKFDIGTQYVRTADKRVSFALVGTNVNPIQLKGITGAFLGMVDEADALTEEALIFLRPTLRAEGSKEIYSFNPTVRTSPMAKMLLSWIDGANGKDADDNLYKSFIDRDKRLGVIFGTYLDNDFLSVASARRILDERRGDMDADIFDNVYNGRFISFTKDSYYSKCLRECEAEGRIANWQCDYSLPIYTSWDLGVNDLMSVVVWQPLWDYSLQKFNVFVIDYFGGSGFSIDYYANLLNGAGYPGVRCFLPHDGNKRTAVSLYSAADILKDMGFTTTIIPNQGKGAAFQRIIKTRQIFKQIYLTKPSFNPRMGQLMESLQHYAPKIVNNLPTDTPDHTYSDPADAFGIIPYALDLLKKPISDTYQSKFDRMEAEKQNRRDYWGAGL